MSSGSVKKNRQSLSTVLLLVGLGLLVLVSIGRAVQFTFATQYGGIDFHSYWYSGLFVRQGNDPYAAYFDSAVPDSPVTFLTGPSDSEGDLDRRLPRIPANTAPLVLLLSGFSWLPWEAAKSIWFIFNLVLAGLLPLMVIRFLTPLPRMQWTAVLLICLIFYALKGTRAALGTGQTTLFVLTLMVLSLVTWKRSWVVSGLLLGLALSKYSIALPIFLFFLYKRQFKLLALSLLVQLAGLLIISGMSGSHPPAILQSYVQIMLVHVNYPGIHLTELLPEGPGLQIIPPVLLSALVLGLFIYQVRRDRTAVNGQDDEKFIDLHVLSILSLWTLLVAYHRPYDGTLILFFIVMMMVGLYQPERWMLSHAQRRGLILYFVIVMAFLILPYEQVGSIFAGNGVENVLQIIAKGVVVSLVTMLAVSFWLWRWAAADRMDV